MASIWLRGSYLTLIVWPFDDRLLGEVVWAITLLRTMSLEVTEKETEGESITTPDNLLLLQQIRVDRGRELLLPLQEGVLLPSDD